MKTSLDDASSCLPFVFSCQRASLPAAEAACPGSEIRGERRCGADRDRTDDIQLAKLALYQLSYSPNQAVVESEWA